MKTLLIMRHAKASWENPGWSDFERPLSPRGLAAAPLIGSKIFENDLQPDLILSSPAKRAKQTAVLVKEVGEINSKIEFPEQIYEASSATLLHILSDLNEEISSVLLIGHNPGIEDLIRKLTGEIQALPSASLAIIRLKINIWSEVNSDCGILELVIRPRDLTKRVEINS